MDNESVVRTRQHKSIMHPAITAFMLWWIATAMDAATVTATYHQAGAMGLTSQILVVLQTGLGSGNRGRIRYGSRRTEEVWQF